MIKLQNLLKENPDRIDTDTIDLEYYDRDAHAFGWYKGKCYMSDAADIHSNIDISDDMSGEYLTRSTFDFPGRLWKNDKVISFWEYPSPSKLNSMIKEINKTAKENKESFKVDKNWKIEVVVDKNGKWAKNIKALNKKAKSNNKSNWNEFTIEDLVGYHVDNVLIPISKYAGSEKRSKSEKGKSHMLSPLLKKIDKAKRSSIVKSREKKKFSSKMPVAKQRSMMTKYKYAENKMIKLKDLLLEKKTISIDTAQDMRKAGYWILVSNNLKKVIAVDKDEKNLMNIQKQNRGKFKLFEPLKTIKISPEQQREYDRLHKLIWKNSKFGG